MPGGHEGQAAWPSDKLCNSCCLFAPACHCPHTLLALCAGDQAAGGPLRERACGAGPAGLARHLELLQGQEGCEPCPRLLSCWQCCAAGMQCTALLRTAAAGGCRGTGQMPLDLQVQARHGVLACHTPSSPALLLLLLQATAARPSCPRTRRCRSAAALATPSTMARWAVLQCQSALPCCIDHRSMCSCSYYIPTACHCRYQPELLVFSLQGRVVTAEFDQFFLVNTYVPNRWGPRALGRTTRMRASLVLVECRPACMVALTCAQRESESVGVGVFMLSPSISTPCLQRRGPEAVGLPRAAVGQG